MQTRDHESTAQANANLRDVAQTTFLRACVRYAGDMGLEAQVRRFFGEEHMIRDFALIMLGVAIQMFVGWLVNQHYGDKHDNQTNITV